MQDETKRYQCRHIFTEGRRCGSPCLRHEEFCYYHHTTRRPVENPHQRRARQAHFDLPLPDDRACHPALHRRSPPPHSPQRDRPQARRPPPLRPPDRQPKPAPSHRTRDHNTRRRDHHRPETRHPRPTRRSRPATENPDPRRRPPRDNRPRPRTRSRRSSRQSRSRGSQQSRSRTSILPTRNHRTRNNPAHSPTQHPGQSNHIWG